MGNTLTVPEEAEDDKTCTVKSYQPLSESPEGIKNGSVVFVQNPPLAVNGEAGAKAGARQDNAAVSSPDTKEQGPAGLAGGQSPGSAARSAVPSARARSALAFPWAVPGRSEAPAAAPAVGHSAVDGGTAVPALSTAPREGTGGTGTAAPQQGSHKNPGQAPLQDVELAGTPEGQHAAAPQPRAVTLLDRIFRPDKGKDRSTAQGHPQEGQELDVPNGSIAAGAPSGAPQGQEIDECKQKELGQGSAGVQGAAAETEHDSPQAAAGHGSVMSFLKTLVSPSKAEAKSDSEDKAAKETQQTTNTKSPEQPPAPPLKSDRNVAPSQDPPAKQNPKAPEAVSPLQGVTPEIPREGTKDKGSATPLPLSKLFWKKNSSEEAEAVGNEKAEVAPEAVAPERDRDESKSAEATEVKPRGAESKTPKANLRKFFKLSVKGDGGAPRPEEGNGPSPSHHTLNATERPLSPSESDRSKESPRDKKAAAEPGRPRGGRHEGREQPEPPGADTDSIHNGGDTAKETSYKKAEKRQSLGGFFKGLGSKRMSDAEVQTDPVSILPAGKSK